LKPNVSKYCWFYSNWWSFRLWEEIKCYRQHTDTWVSIPKWRV